MNSEQIKDMHLLYNAVYNEELREKFEEYNNTVYDEDIVEVATEYFYSYGLNADGIDILIEKVGLESFVEYVYELSENLILTEARKVSKAKKQPGSLRSRQKEKLAAQRAATDKKEIERTKPESRGAESEAKAEQPKSKKPERTSIADRISNAIKSGVERHNTANDTLNRLAGETGKTLGKLAKGVGHVAGQFGAGAGTVAKASKKALVGEKVEAWVNSLIEEGYDLSEYTWDDMYEIYLDESAKRTPKKVRGAKDAETEMSGRSDAGKRISGDEKTGPRYYALGRRVSPDAPTQPGEKPVNTPKLSQSEKDEMEYRKANLKAGKTHKVGGEKGLPESYDMFDYILEHLVAEGYADTNAEALVIMANMSEEWKQSIMEGNQFNSLTEYSAFLGGKIGGGEKSVTVGGSAHGFSGSATFGTKRMSKDGDAAAKATTTNAIADYQNKERSNAIASRSLSPSAAKPLASSKINPKAKGAAVLGGGLSLSSSQKAEIDANRAPLPAVADKVSEPEAKNVSFSTASFDHRASGNGRSSSRSRPSRTPSTDAVGRTPSTDAVGRTPSTDAVRVVYNRNER